MKVQEIVNSLRIDGSKQRIELGGLVRVRKTGEIGRTTQVTTTHLFVRFQEGAKAKYIYRNAVDSVPYLRAQGECIEDDANADAFRAEMDRQYAMVGWTAEMAQAEREAEERGFLSGI